MRSFVVCIVLAAACAEAPLVKTTVPIQALKQSAPFNQDGLQITVDTIGYDNWKSHGQVVTRISWQEIDRNAPVMMGRGGGGATPTVTRSDDVPLVPLPTILVSITNQGQKPLA